MTFNENDIESKSFSKYLYLFIFFRHKKNINVSFFKNFMIQTFNSNFFVNKQTVFYVIVLEIV